MAAFTVNGQSVTVEKNQKLLRYLRDELHLTSVKDGCSEGACGTCTVLIDGKPTKACVPQTDKLEGKTIVTVEGLSDFERDVYTYAFGMAGAVQCGFCIPGMVMSAKGLLDKNPSPTREEAAFAIRNNICRCTGYVKIIDAILLAAELFRAGEVPKVPKEWTLGARVPRVDVQEKVTGTGIYPDDIYLDGMIYGSAVRSQYPRARVLAIHTEEAKALPGVVGVFTAADIPGNNKVGHLKKDWDTMIAVGDITHYLGDAICLVAAETPEILAQAKALVKVDYEELPMVRSPRDAMLPDAPLVHKEGNLLAHKHIQRGNPAEAIAKSKYVLTQRFSTPWTEHAFLEPECAVAYPDGEGVMVLSTDQGAYDTQHEIMGMLGLPAELVKVRNCLVGGGFGGKEDVTVQHHAALAVGAEDQNLGKEIGDLPGREVHHGQNLLAHKLLRTVMVGDLGGGTLDPQLLAHVHLQLIGRLTGLFKILRADNGAHADIQLQKIIKACHYCSLLFTVCFSGSSLTMAAPRISTAPVRPNRPSFSPRISADRSTATTGSI